MARVLLILGFLGIGFSVLGQEEEAPYFPMNGLDSLPIFRDLEMALLSEEPVYRLDLSKQRFKSFPEEILQLTSLRELNISKTKIPLLPEAFADLKELEVLHASKNKWEEWPVEIFVLEKLRYLDVSSNELETLPDELGGLQQLEHFVAWGNPFAYFTEELANLPALAYLDLFLVEMDKGEQANLREWLPNVIVSMSEPCDCNFSEGEE